MKYLETCSQTLPITRDQYAHFNSRDKYLGSIY